MRVYPFLAKHARQWNLAVSAPAITFSAKGGGMQEPEALVSGLDDVAVMDEAIEQAAVMWRR